jgi:hypothetical protein
MKLQSLVLLAALIFGASAFANGKEGGGGQGVLCTDSNQNRTLVPLDLFEAQGIWGTQIPVSSPIQDEISRVLPNYDLFHAEMAPNETPFALPTAPTAVKEQALQSQYESFVSSLRAIPAGTHLTLSNDNGGLILQPPKGCQLVQVLYYADENDESGQVLVDSDYWNLLSPQSRLAFYFHETIYKSLRFAIEQSSTRTRRIVGMLLDSKPFPGPAVGLQGLESAQYCYASADSDADISFYAVPSNTALNGQPRLKLVFDSLAVKPDDLPYMLVSTTADSMWSYQGFMSGYLNTSGQELRTESVLGSTTIRLSETDMSCVGNTGKKCRPTIKVLTQDGQWVGGPIECRTVK